MKHVWIVLFFGTLLGATDGFAQSKSLQQEVSTTARIDLSSAHVFRGETRNRGAVIQPALGIESPSGISASVWANLDIHDNRGQAEPGQFSEIDISIAYNIPLAWPLLQIKIGAFEYLRPGKVIAVDEDRLADRELNLSIMAPVMGHPSLKVFYGIEGDVKKQTFYEFGLSDKILQVRQFVLSFAGYGSYIDRGDAARLDPIDGDSLEEDGVSHGKLVLDASYQSYRFGFHYVLEANPDVLDRSGETPYYVVLGHQASF